MIPKVLDQIAEADILALITNSVAEGRAIEYKRDLPGTSDADKREFLADVSSFANTAGGDLIYGIEESQGTPTRIVGLSISDPDLQIRRLDDSLASGLEPRIRYASRLVQVAHSRDRGKKMHYCARGGRFGDLFVCRWH